MPYVTIDGQRIKFDYNPDLVASLIYQGHEVEADEGASETDIKYQEMMTKKSLKKLWGDKKIRTTPMEVQRGHNASPGVPDSGPTNPQGRSVFPAGTPRHFREMEVTPNPFNNYHIKEFEGGYEKPITTEANNNWLLNLLAGLKMRSKKA